MVDEMSGRFMKVALSTESSLGICVAFQATVESRNKVFMQYESVPWDSPRLMDKAFCRKLRARAAYKCILAALEDTDG